MKKRNFVLFLTAALCAGVYGCSDCDGDGCGENYGVNPEFSVTKEALSAYCSIAVEGYGTVAMETEYVPNVTWCENGGAPEQALAAQAAAARTFAYYKIKTGGTPVKNSQGDQVYKCESRSPSAAQLQRCKDATNTTSGYVMTYKGTITAGFYVSGVKPAYLNSECKFTGDSNSTGWVSQQKYVTYNWNKSGTKANGFTQTSLGWVNDGNYANRGCMSQNGATCLANNNWQWQNILKFFYGADINIEHAEGSCVTETKKCETTLSKSGTIIDDQDPCFSKANSESWYVVNSGYNDHLYYTYVWDKAAEAIGTWNVNVTRPGTYEVFAYIQSGVGAVSEKAPYVIRASGKNNSVSINLNGKSGWVSLGKYTFASGGDQYVQLSDASGEPYTDKNGKRVLFDAIKFEDAVICNNACTEGAVQCSGNGFQKCTKGSNGCTAWGSVTACGANQKCDAGKCVATCTDACTSGAKQCSGNGYQTCAKGGNGCLAWSSVTACGANQTCQNGSCVATCKDACTEGARQCSGNAVQVCAKGASGCLEWGAATACADGKTCQNGACTDSAQSCTDECNAEGAVCSGDAVVECGQFDDDPCLDYKKTPCTDGNVCSGGKCVPSGTPCESKCAENAKKCVDNGIVECTDDDGDGCFEWSQNVTPCQGDDTCIDGVCEPPGSEPQPAECLTEIDGRPSVIIDDSDGCFVRNDDYPAWNVLKDYGYKDYLYYTPVKDDLGEAKGVWNLNVTKGGEYQIYAYVEGGIGHASKNAMYTVKASGKTHNVTVDMSKQSGWVELGTYTLKKGAKQYVELTNSTGENSEDGLRVIYDAIKVVPKTTENGGSSEMPASVSIQSPSCSAAVSGPSSSTGNLLWILGIAGSCLVLRRRKRTE